MGEIVIVSKPLSASYAAYYDRQGTLIAVEDLSDVRDRMIRECVNQDDGGGIICPPGTFPVECGGRRICVK